MRDLMFAAGLSTATAFLAWSVCNLFSNFATAFCNIL